MTIVDVDVDEGEIPRFLDRRLSPEEHAAEWVRWRERNGNGKAEPPAAARHHVPAANVS